MSPTLTDTCLPDVKLLLPHVHADARGHFLESWREPWGAMLPGFEGAFVQDNVSLSRKHVLRGLHFQNPDAQGKLVRAVWGDIYDVTVDVRVGSPTFGRWQALTLSGDDARQLWVPPGYAHGFLVLSEQALVEYKCTAYYAPRSEACLCWNDPGLGIEWPCGEPVLSDKDRRGETLQALREAGRCPSYGVAGAGYIKG